MTVGQLISLLKQFPTELPVYFCHDELSGKVIPPESAVAALVHPQRCVMADDGDPAKTVSHDFIHAVVLQAAPAK